MSLFLDRSKQNNHYISYCLVKMTWARLVFKISLRQFIDVWWYPWLNDIFNFSSTLTIMMYRRVKKHRLIQGVISIPRIEKYVILNSIWAWMITAFHACYSLDNTTLRLFPLMQKFWPREKKVARDNSNSLMIFKCVSCFSYHWTTPTPD